MIFGTAKGIEQTQGHDEEDGIMFLKELLIVMGRGLPVSVLIERIV